MKTLFLILILSTGMDTIPSVSKPWNPQEWERAKAERRYQELKGKPDPESQREFARLTVELGKLPHPLWQECNWVKKSGQETKVNCEAFP